MSARRRRTALLAVVGLLVASCSGSDGTSEPTTPSTTPSTTPRDGTVQTSTSGNTPQFDGAALVSGDARLGFSLSEGSASDRPAEATTVVDGRPLDPTETQSVLDRLAEWNLPDNDQVDFNRPVESLKPPVVGNTVDTPFPPAVDADPPDSTPDGPLEVLRFQPVGNVDVAPFVSVTFSEPMVPLGTLDQLDEAEVPLVIEPALPAGVDGRWRWIGTRTLRFEVEPADIDRLPAATEYRLTVPAGTTSANGASLDEATTWSFTTPAPTVTGLSGLGESMDLNPVFVATFDQRVDAVSVVEHIELDAGDVTSVRVATAAEVAADTDASQAIDAALDDRAVAFVPSSTLQPGTTVRVTVTEGVESLEGDRAGTTKFTDSGATYGAFEVRRGCEGGLEPLQSFGLQMSNSIDLSSFDPTMITVEPAIPGLRVDVFDAFLNFRGATSGDTEYTITLSGEMADSFGQKLGDDVTVTCRVGQARSLLAGPNRRFVTVDPFSETPTLSFTTVGHSELRVVAWRVEPDQYRDYERYLETTYSDTRPADPKWPVVLDRTVSTGGDVDPNDFTETVVDLTDAFAESPSGQIVIRVEPNPPIDPKNNEYWQNQPLYTWVQQTGVGIDAVVGGRELLIWTTDLRTGEPIGNVEVALIGPGGSATTDADGLARVDLTSSGVQALVATVDGTTAMLAASWDWSVENASGETRGYVIDDRGIYRPGETMRLVGLVRNVTAADQQLALPSDGLEVAYTVYDPQGNDLASGSIPVNALGGFNLDVEIPEASNTGLGNIEFNGGGGWWYHQFQIQDFRTPDFEVVARAESPAPFYASEPATIAVDASYFAGGPLPDAEVNWLVTTSDATYRPPNWDRFNFGVWVPWWWYGSFTGDVGYGYDECFDCGPGSERFEQFVGRTNGAGQHFLNIDFDDVADDGTEPTPGLVDQPTNVVADATVFDVNRQAISSRTTLLVHSSQYYVGLRSDRTFVRQGEPLEIDVAVVDVDGAPVAERTVEVTAGRIDYRYDDGQYVEELVDEQTCTITSSDTVGNNAPDPTMRCDFDTPVGGQYRITAIVIDDDGRPNRAELTQWVSGATAPPTRNLDQGTVTIVPNQQTYAPGDTAELLVQAPFAPASGMVTVTRAGVESVQIFEASDGSAVIEIPIADDDIPALQVRVDMVGATPRTADDGTALDGAPNRPAFAAGTIGLSIPPVARTLTVTPSPASDTLQPGESTAVSVIVTGPDGEPVADAGVALIVVDEAVLSLTGYTLLDPLGVFYREPYANLSPELIRSSIVLANPLLFGEGAVPTADAPVETEAPAEEAAADADFSAAGDDAGAARLNASPGGGESAVEQPEIDVRTNFDALAVFAPDERTGTDGTVSVDVELPDNLTRYRIMAVAVDGADHFGSGESSLTARLPITVRPSAPRFLNWGDRFELPVVVQNQTDADVEVDVVIEGSNLALTGDVGKRVVVPANDRVEVRFDAATDSVGTARFRVAVAAVGQADDVDAAEVALPVYTPATAEAFATYGVIDGNGVIAQPVLAPDGVLDQFGGLQVSTSSTALQALTDAVLYLHEYRYDSSDGFASRIMAIAALRDVLDAFDAEGLPSPAALNAQVESDAERLLALQNDDGGFPYWQRGRPSEPWVSVQSAHALTLASTHGYSINADGLARAIDHLRNIEEFIPADYPEVTKDAISAYALHVRNLAGDRDSAKANALYERAGDTMQIDAVAQLWPVIDESSARSAIERRIENAAVETAAAVTFATDYGEDAYLIAQSDRRTDGIVLGALISEAPDSDLIPKAVAGLLANQTRGRWNNAHENAFILLAMNDYFNTFESVDPDFIARVWLGDTYIAEAVFQGRSVDTQLSTVAMAELVTGDATSNLVLANDGSGRLYYRLGLRYAPDDFVLDARDEGFVVERTYHAVDDPDDVRRDADGTWRIKAGATVEVRLNMVADARRTHVALIDPLPAGLEAVNPALATSITVPPADDGGGDGDAADAARSSWWWWSWYDHQNLRDDRVEAFSSYLPGGTYDYTYFARATTPGSFVVPPTRAEEIYAPEVFGRSSSDSVIVE